MTKYDVYVICNQCGQPHPVNVSLNLEDPDLNKTMLADHFAGLTLPAAIVFMQTNNYRCPHTKQLFPASDIGEAILFEAS